MAMEAPARVRPVELPATPSAQPPATLPAPAEAPPRPDGGQAKKRARGPIRQRRISPLTRRILLLNCLPLAILFGGLLY
ncbi:MAG: sensor N-terminal transmembrane domain-containing protein, partial [Proteobacteria bacterium]|nr:sensor N-terminal transmembrane domain-containing protein [Pseudomonadota bacterium]